MTVLKERGAESIYVQAASPSKVFFKKHFGKKYRYFDLASVTKAIFTTPVVIQLVQEGKLSLNKTLGDYLAYVRGTPLARVKIKNLLDQTSGITWWKPFYKSLLKLPLNQRGFALKKLLLKEKLKKNPKCEYSDLNFIFLGQVISEIEKAPLDKVFKKRIAQPLNLKNTFFVSTGQKVRRSQFAPTEKNYRGVVQGIVHDDNAASFGGISSHAGLFSTPEETTIMATELLKAYEGKSKFYKKSVFRKFTKRAVSKTKGDWALGFMIPSKPSSTGGTKISKESFGFPGFTGTSIWIDTKRKAVVVILSNRTYPTRKNEVFRQTRIKIHDEIWNKIDGK